MISSRRSDSSRVSDAVGSSITISRASRASARRISTFCWSAMRSVCDAPAGAKAEADPLVELARSVQRAAPVDEPTAPSSTPEEHVLEHGQRGHERELLVRSVAMPASSASRGERNATGSPSTSELAVVRLDGAADDLAERRLAGAVLADERVDLAGRDRDADIVERPSSP